MAQRLCIFLFLSGALFAQTPEEYQSSDTAERYLSMCGPLTNAKTTPDGKVNVVDSFETGQCAGALDAISVLASMRDRGKPVLGICPPSQHTLVQWAAIFTDYTIRHPKRYTEPFAIVAVAALQEAYSCRK